MAWLSVYREAAGWLVLTQAACVAVVARLIARRPRPQVGDDAIAMVRQSRADDKFIDDLERQLAEMDKQIRRDLGG